MKVVFAVPLLLASTLSGCVTGKIDYIKPSPVAKQTFNSVVLGRPVDEAWKSSVAKLSTQYFVINNMDRSSGLINLSYSGDPEQFVDCGTITSDVSNARGPRSYRFPASRAKQQYEFAEGGNLFVNDRTMNMEGRINLLLQAETETTTKATVNARYVLTKTIHTRQYGGGQGNFTDSAAFNTGQTGVFSPGSATEVTCVPTGKLEDDILSALQ